MAVYMLSENNLALKEIQASIVSADKKLTTQQIQSMLVSQIKALGFTPDTASDEIYYKACAWWCAASSKKSAATLWRMQKPRDASRPTICAWNFYWDGR